MRFNAVRKLFDDHAHLAPRRGTREQARNYCMKEDTRKQGPFEGGDWRLGGAGTRVDLLLMTDRIREGATETDISSEFPVNYIKYRRGIQGLINLSEKVRDQPPEIILCYGPTGTGKTKHCYDTWPKLYRKPCDTRWFDRYQGHSTLLLDDFGGAMSKMSLMYLLQLLDRYPLLVEAKGTYCNLMATTIVITTNHHPRQWYTYEKREESYRALERRIHQVLYFGKYGEEPVECQKEVFFQNYFEGMDVSGYIQEKIEESDSTEETEENSSESSEEEELSQPSQPSTPEEIECDYCGDDRPHANHPKEAQNPVQQNLRTFFGTKRKLDQLVGRDLTDEGVAKRARQKNNK